MRTSTLILAARQLMLYLLWICAWSSSGQGLAAQADPDAITKRVQTNLEQTLATQPDLPGILLHIEAPDHQFSRTAVAGVRDLVTATPLTGREGVRIASVTKTYVAAATLRLWEDGALGLDDPIARYITPAHQQLLLTDNYDAGNITIRHLLSHVSGLYDHGSSRQYFDEILADPMRRWTRTDQIRGCVDWGEPVGRVGERFSYSDTGYILLGEAIEKITGLPLGIALRHLLDYEHIGLNETWFEITEPRPPSVPDRAHQYVDSIDSYTFHPSIDLYGGGGLVTTVREMARFYQALFNDEVFRSTATLDTMLASYVTSDTSPPRMDYRKGIYHQVLKGEPVWTHSGFWGTQVIYVPRLNASIAVAVTRQQAFGAVRPLLEKVIGLLEEIDE